MRRSSKEDIRVTKCQSPKKNRRKNLHKSCNHLKKERSLIINKNLDLHIYHS